MRLPFAALLLVACASPPPVTAPTGGPRGLRASDHLDVAQQHENVSKEATMWPDSMGDGMPHGVPIPWVRSWNEAADHARLAALHRGQAASLQADFERACGTRSIPEVAVSPLVRYGAGGWMTQTGAIVYLSSDAGDPDALLAAMACHRAWMMLAPTGMDECPLDLPGLVLDARGDADGITVSLGVRDPTLVPELQRRVAIDLEAGPHAAHAAHAAP